MKKESGKVVFDYKNIGNVVSNPSVGGGGGMDICPHFSSVFVLSFVGRSLAMD
jgi:hypothetical protein